MEEIWKDIKGYEGKYQVSNFGRVRSLNRLRWNGRVYCNQKGKIMSQSIGYNKKSQCYMYPYVSFHNKSGAPSKKNACTQTCC